MDIMKYKLFADIVDTGSFTKSGRNLGYTQPSVSHILKALEAEIGFALFVRTKQGVSILPELVIRDMEYPIRALPLEPYATRELGIACRSDAGLTPAAKQFIQIMQETLPALTGN